MEKHQEAFMYLKPMEYYTDLYDLFTIKACLEVIELWKDLYKKKDTDEKLKEIPADEVEGDFNYCFGWEIRIEKGERYRKKAKTIKEWIDRDTVKQDKLDATSPPSNIICPYCKVEMLAGDFKDLEDFDEGKPLRVLFFFECHKCKKRKGFFDNGKEYTSKPNLCPNCGKKVKVTFIKKGEVITTITKCPSCKYKNVEIDDWEKSRLEHEANKKKDKELLEKYREEFCLSDKDGQAYLELIEAMEVANAVREEEMQKYDNPVYQRSLQLKKTTIVDLEKLLINILEKAKYTKLSFDKPDIGQYVIVPFTVQDLDSLRKDRISVSELEKLINRALEDTNWRLLSNSIMYRLGYLEGRLKGYENEEDMLKLAGKKENPKLEQKIDDLKRQKYISNNLVQLARLLGEQEGIENMRKRRLAKEPDGFFLEASEGPLGCGICGGQHPGNEIWWNLDGLRCSDCWRNIKEGVIPSNLKHMYDNDGQWISNWQIHSDYGVHPGTRDKLIRQGFLKAKKLKDKKGAIYCTLFLVSENKDFLDKYPKQKSEIEVNIVDSKGSKVML
ncbi:MAG: ZPR1-type zinc finger protein [Candidatus Omnitrophica bacterium]|nr:ZPR1-type zinc finger protein [Candidatus Omnitrophota bacterium]